MMNKRKRVLQLEIIDPYFDIKAEHRVDLGPKMP